jgi:L-ascorbate metabolism protein UlaG (beta-lactamase superfamily)
MARLVAAPFAQGLAERLRAPRAPGVTLFWLGQAGFVLDAGPHRLLIDPYLSDTLAAKYAGTAYLHERMMAAPVSPRELGHVDLVLVTHQHTDHMDPGTLAPLAHLHPGLAFVVPRAALAQARERIGVEHDRLRALDAGEIIEPLPGISIRAVRAAHETLERDEAGHYRFLGYGLNLEGVTLLHPGDTIPFEGQTDELAQLGADVALLPVNGRSEALRRAGFAGNLTVEEAIALCDASGIGALIAHHYGMFDFNTADPEAIDRAAATAPMVVERARLQMAYHVSSQGDGGS